MSLADRPLPAHLVPESPRLTFLADEFALHAVLRGEPAPRLRQALVELLASERIDRDGVGRVRP